MKDIFYMLMIVLVSGAFVLVLQYPRQQNLDEFKSGIVIDKSTDAIFGNMIEIKRNDTINFARCYDIIFDVYEVGDTIK